MKRLLLAGLLASGAILSNSPALAQTGPASVVNADTCPVATVLNPGNGRYLIETRQGYLCVLSSGGGGGGAVTIADGADVTQGALADAACATDNGNCTVEALIKRNNQRLTTLLAGIPVTQSGTWTVQPGNTANTTAWKVDGSAVTQPVSGTVTVTNTTSNGAALTSYVLEPAASDNHATIKNGAGTLNFVHSFNNSATINYLRFYDAGTGFNGCNSATNLIWEMHIPANTSDAGFVENLPAQGLPFTSGLSICVTGAYGQTSTAAATASAISISALYK